MSATSLAASALLTLVVGLALQPVVVRLARAASVIDTPCARSSHTVPTPRGGGAAVVLAAVAGLLIYPPARVIAVPLLLFAAIGLLEDVRGVPAGHRLLLQAGAGVAAAVLLLPVLPADPGAAASVAPVSAVLLAVLVVAVWLTGYANAFNFMDGVNGISAVHATIAGAVYVTVGIWYALPVLAVTGAVAAAAALTFVPWNAGRARIFLGDVGSYGLGGLLGVAAAYGLLYGAPVEVVAAPLALYLADTGWTLARRCAQGEAWFRPHRGHIYQRLTDLGWSHQRVTALTALASTAVCAGALAAAAGGPWTRLSMAALVVTVLIGYLAAPAMLTARPVVHDRRVHA